MRRLSKIIYFNGVFIGPVQVKDPHHPTANYEALCHLCKWADYKRTAETARDVLLWHLDQHFNPPKPYKIKAKDMPGYGAVCNGRRG